MLGTSSPLWTVEEHLARSSDAGLEADVIGAWVWVVLVMGYGSELDPQQGGNVLLVQVDDALVDLGDVDGHVQVGF